MANHKRRRPKNRRAGCLMCKPHKGNGVKKRGRVGGLGSVCRTWKDELVGYLSEIEQIREIDQENDDEVENTGL
jgi:hypothetical protein